jgi:hypothetical protein
MKLILRCCFKVVFCNGLLLTNCKFPTITFFLFIASNLGDVPSTILGFFIIIYTMWRNCEEENFKIYSFLSKIVYK